MSANGKIESAMERLSEEVRELSLGTTGEIERIKNPPTPTEFLRNWVLPGRPCIITNAVDHWPALQKWSDDYLRSTLKDQSVSVHFTPDGRADSLVDPLHVLSMYDCSIIRSVSDSSRSSTHPASHATEKLTPDSVSHSQSQLVCSDGECQTKRAQEDAMLEKSELLFVRPHVEQLPFSEALDLIIGRSRDGENVGIVAYAQEQNGCFLSEYGPLNGDAEVHIPWASEALGSMPEAVNLWIGNERSVTSFHKDHYENLYTVVAGEKLFTLLPPVDVHKMYIKEYTSAQYVRLEGNERRLGIVVDQPLSTVPWVTVDPYPASNQQKHRSQFPKYFHGSRPFTCTVRAGETLYLPSMWFHHVRQAPDPEGRTIALNFCMSLSSQTPDELLQHWARITSCDGWERMVLYFVEKISLRPVGFVRRNEVYEAVSRQKVDPCIRLGRG